MWYNIIVEGIKETKKEIIIMKLDNTKYIGYGLDLDNLLNLAVQTGMRGLAYRATLYSTIDKEAYVDYVADFNDDLSQTTLPDVSTLTVDGHHYVYFKNADLADFTNVHNIIPVLSNCVAEILWSEYSAFFDDGEYPVSEDEYFETVKHVLTSRQKSLFSRISANN